MRNVITLNDQVSCLRLRKKCAENYKISNLTENFKVQRDTNATNQPIHLYICYPPRKHSFILLTKSISNNQQLAL